MYIIGIPIIDIIMITSRKLIITLHGMLKTFNK